MSKFLFDLAINLSLLAVLALLYGSLRHEEKHLRSWIRHALFILLYSAPAVLALLYRLEPVDGLVVDLRPVVIFLGSYYCGAYIGAVAALVSSIVDLAFFSGIAAYPAAILGLIIPVLVVLLKRSVRGEKDPGFGAVLWISSVVFFLISLAQVLMRIPEEAAAALKQLALLLGVYELSAIVAYLFSSIVLESSRLLDATGISELRYRSLFEYAPVALYEEDFSELAAYIAENPDEFTDENVEEMKANSWRYFDKIRIIAVNRAAVQLAGARDADDLLARRPEMASPGFSDALIQEIISIRMNKRFFMTKTQVRNFSGELQHVVIQWIVQPGAEEDFSRVLVSIIDTTTAVRQSRQLRQNLEQKQQLIREVHHRVRNSLSLAYSILGLQLGEEIGGELEDMIQGTMNRIQAIALIHTRLYQNKEIHNMNVHNYLRDLLDVLKAQTRVEGINIKLNAPDRVMHIDQILPLGIIINELITNSQKHAFPKDHPGEKGIWVHLKIIGDRCSFTISDNGVGLDPAQMNASTDKSLGMTLLMSLAEQLNGDVSYHKGKWSSIKIDFPLQELN